MLGFEEEPFRFYISRNVHDEMSRGVRINLECAISSQADREVVRDDLVIGEVEVGCARKRRIARIKSDPVRAG
jgi:hypothetical protein